MDKNSSLFWGFIWILRHTEEDMKTLLKEINYLFLYKYFLNNNNKKLSPNVNAVLLCAHQEIKHKNEPISLKWSWSHVIDNQ